MIEALIAALRAARIELTAEEVADICWLYASMPPRIRSQEAEEKKQGLPPPQGEKGDRHPPTLPPNEKQPEPEGATDKKPPPVHDRKGELLPASGSGANGASKGVPFRVPAAIALPGSLELTRALRPLMKRVASRTQRRLDEHATVDRIAEQRIWMPVMRSTPERWLEAALVTEDSFEMRPWARTIREFQRLLGHSGAFRDVRPWRLAASVGGGFRLSNGSGTALRKPRELIDAAGARVILIVSDCSSVLWRDDAFIKTLKDWGARQPVAVIQVLPQPLWTSTVLRDTSAVRVHLPRPGAPNAKFAMEPAAHRRRSRPTGMGVPIITLEKPSVSAWASTVAAVAGASAHARFFPPFASTPSVDRTLEQAWERFRTASPLAQDLARLLAAAPLTLPIMRLVQRTMLPESKQVHLAEIFRSELIFPLDDSADAESVRYEFREDIRSRLLDEARASDSVGVLRAALSEFIGARTGQPLDFLAMLRDPDAESGLALGPETQPFADVAAQVLSRMGGRYQALADRLTKGHTPKPETDAEPVWKPEQVPDRHVGPVSVLAFSPDGTLLASGSSDMTVRLRDLRTGQDTFVFAQESEILSAAFSPDSGKLAIAETSGVIFVRHLAPPGIVDRTPLGMLATSLAFSWDGQSLVGVTMHEIFVWDANLREVRRRFSRERNALAACNPAGYAVAESDGTGIWIRDLQTGTDVAFRSRGSALYRGEHGSVLALAFSPAGHYLAAYVAGAMIIWDPQNGQELSIFDADIGAISALGLSADARLLAAVSTDGVFRLWETATGLVLRSLTGVRSIAFSLTENKLAFGTDAGNTLVRDLQDAVTPANRVLTGQATIPRSFRIVSGPQLARRAVAEAVTEGLRHAGHTIPSEPGTVPEVIIAVDNDAIGEIVVSGLAAGEAVPVITLKVDGKTPGEIDFHDPSLWQAGFEQLLRKLDELPIPGPPTEKPELEFIFFVSCAYEERTAAEIFVEDVAKWGGRQRRFFMSNSPAHTIREEEMSDRASRAAAALLVLLSPDYLSSSSAALELRAFLHRQSRFGLSGFVIPVIFKPCEVPEGLRELQAITMPSTFMGRGAAYSRCLQDVADALDRIAAVEPQLPPLPEDFDLTQSLPEARQPYSDPAWLAATVARRGYRDLLRELYARPELSEFYWALLTSIRGEDESWEEWFGRIQNNPSDDADRPSDRKWHEAMWIVGASLNDHNLTDADAQPPVEELARQFPELLELLRRNRGNSPVSRVAIYYAFLIQPTLDTAEDLINTMNPASEELGFGRAVLPWFRCVSWIAARMYRDGLIRLVQEKIDAVQVVFPGGIAKNRGEFADACRDEIHQRIRPWVALADLANAYVLALGQRTSGDDQSYHMTQIAQKMEALAGALNRGDLERLLRDPLPGRRLIAFSVLTAQPDLDVRVHTISAVVAERQPFMQLRGLMALRAIVAKGSAITPNDRAELVQLRQRLPDTGRRVRILRELLNAAQPLVGKKILWVDDHPKNIDKLVMEFRQQGALVRTVSTTDGVFSELSKADCDLVISDLHRDANSEAGFEMIRLLRQSGNAPPAVIYSRYLTEQRIRSATALNIECFNDAAALRAAVAEWNWSTPRLLPKGWVLVAGTGRSSGLPKAVQIGAELAALAVAEDDAGMITGGWPGVDHIAAREFTKVIEARGAAVESFLVHVLDRSGAADFERGKVEVYSQDSGTEAVRRADSVILVGGEGGTWDIFRAALALGKPVIPLAGSGGDAERAWSLLRLAPGTSHLQSPRLVLTDRDTALRDGVPALAGDLKNPADLTTGAGLLTVDLVTVVLPLAAEYMRPVSVGEFEHTASRIRKQLQPWGEFLEDVIPVLLRDASPEWRVTGYLAFQTHPQTEQIPALLECLPVELKEIESGRETRPFFQWINSLYTCLARAPLREALPPDLARELRAALVFLERRNDVDTEGQCKGFLRAVLSSLEVR